MSLVNELIKGLLPEEEKQQTTALYAGGFKPPTSGHFEVVEQALKENPEIDEFIIFVGAKERDGISQDESMLIWDIYKQYLPLKVKIEPTSIPPIKAVYNFAKEHPTREVLWVIGAREGNEEDFKDITSRTKSITNYPNLELRTIVTKGGVSGTAARNASKVSLEKFVDFIPSKLTDEEKQEVYNLVSNKIQESRFATGTYLNIKTLELNEEASYSQHIDYKQKIKDLTKHMLDKGMNIQPLPKVRFVHGDSSNASQFLGKTAYYDPNNQEIVLYTEGRHPKDIVRSFSHEMVHHTQNLENRLGNITTTNTQEDDELDKIEQEANLTGTMTFRNWTDSLQERKTKDPFGINAYAMELGRLREDEEQPWKIYLDMDGVLADFDQRFKDLSGMAPREFENKYGKNAFWDFIDEGDNKIKFWAGIPVMDGAKQLVDFAKDYDYELLTAPSNKKQSLIGKSVWVKKHTGDIFPTKPKVNFKKARNKHLIKPELTKYDILVDDRASTIDNWNNAGGTGILYTSSNQVINDLKKLGL